MSGHGAPTTAVEDLSALKVAVVASSWHEEVMTGLVAGSRRALADFNVDAPVVRVPGSFELAVIAAEFAKQGYDAVVALGVVIRGGTPHFQFVSQAATDGLNRVAADHGVPVGFGLLTCDTDEQALDRAGLPGSSEDKGYEATSAALLTAATLRRVRAGQPLTSDS